MTKAKVEVVSEKNLKQERRTKLADLLEKKLEVAREEVKQKTYHVSGGLPVAKYLYNFIKNDAKWKFTESLGIMESARILHDQIKQFEDKSNTEKKELELTAVTIEAIYYFMTKEEDKGLPKALNFVNNLLHPISEALQNSKADREKINQMERDLGTLQDAVLNKVGVENEDELLKEIENEFEEELASAEEK